MILNKLVLEFDPSDETVTKDRDKYIGGSDTPIIMGVSGFNTAYGLKLEKLGLKEKDLPEEGNYYTQYGHQIEPYIRDYVNKTYNKNFEVACGINEEAGIRCNFDGLDVKNMMVLEVKSNNGKHEDITDYLYQMNLYMNQSGITEALLAMYTRSEVEDHRNIKPEEFKPENLKVIPVKYNPQMAEDLLEHIKRFREIGIDDVQTSIDFYSKLHKLDKNEVDKIKESLSKISDVKALDVIIENRIAQINNDLINIDEVQESLENFGIYEGENFTITNKAGTKTFDSNMFLNNYVDELTDEEKEMIIVKEETNGTRRIMAEKSFKNFILENTNTVEMDVNINEILDLKEEETLEDKLENRDLLVRYSRIIKDFMENVKEETNNAFENEKMREVGFSNGVVKYSYPNPKEVTLVDKKKLELLRPDLYEKSQKVDKGTLSFTKFKIKNKTLGKEDLINNVEKLEDYIKPILELGKQDYKYKKAIEDYKENHNKKNTNELDVVGKEKAKETKEIKETKKNSVKKLK